MKLYKESMSIHIFDICKLRSISLKDNITLGRPGRLKGGYHYSSIQVNNRPLYMKIDYCNNKQGVVKSSNGKRSFIELLFDVHGTEYVDWFIHFEDEIKQKIKENANTWFHNDIDSDDIDQFYNSSIKNYKNDIILRCNIVMNDNILKCPIFDKDETIVSDDKIIDKSIACVLHIKGIKYTQSSFQLDIIVNQILIRDDDTYFDTCILKNIPKQNTNDIMIDTDKFNLNENTHDESIKEQINIETEENDTISQDLNSSQKEYSSSDEKKGNSMETGSLREHDINIQDISESSINLKNRKRILKESYTKTMLKMKQYRKKAIREYLDALKLKSEFALFSESDTDIDTDIEDNESKFLIQGNDEKTMDEIMNFDSISREELENEVQ